MITNGNNAELAAAVRSSDERLPRNRKVDKLAISLIAQRSHDKSHRMN